jgi:hypothetical protein
MLSHNIELCVQLPSEGSLGGIFSHSRGTHRQTVHPTHQRLQPCQCLSQGCLNGYGDLVGLTSLTPELASLYGESERWRNRVTMT